MRKVVTVIITSYSGDEADRLREVLLCACKVSNLRMTNGVMMDKRRANMLSFDVPNMVFFPDIINNVRENKERYQLTVSAYIGDKKVDLSKIK